MCIRLLLTLLLLAGTAAAQPDQPPYLGLDLSFVNEMEDCGAVYKTGGDARDPFVIFAEAGANLARIRLWVAPHTGYSAFDDAVKSLRRAQDAGLHTLLDFHYSDTWADPSNQTIPAAWATLDDAALEAQVYEYTAAVLSDLDTLGLRPQIVQVGNEINTEVLRPEGTPGYPIHWARNAALINAGIRAVRDTGDSRVMLHIAQPENAAWWFGEAARAGITDFDLIGLSYYTGWSDYSIIQLGETIGSLRETYGVGVMVVETAYPWTLDYADNANNNIGADFIVPDYPATTTGQREYLIDLTQTVIASGGSGVVYWGADWLTTPCETRWGTGSHWENAALFDFDGDLIPRSTDFLRHDYLPPTP